MPKLILGFVGEMASGKGLAAKYLKEKHGASTHRFSDPLRDVLSRIGEETSRENLIRLSGILRASFGQNLLAKILSEDAQKNGNRIIIVDGIRRFPDIEYLRPLPEFKLVYVTADLKTRYERLLARGENAGDTRKTLAEFKKDHEAETEINIPKIGATADYNIENNKTEAELYEAIDRIIAKHS